MTYKLHTRKQTEVDLPAIRYKGSYAEVNGKKATLIDSNRGTIKFRAKRASILLPSDIVLQNHTMSE